MSGIRAKRRRWLALAFLGALVLVVPAAWATDTFTDVPASNPHHDDINDILVAGITSGCAPSLYCPDQAVRRDQMASFLRRGLGRVGRAGTLGSVALTGTFQDIALTSITTGGSPGQGGFVLAIGEFTAREAFPGNLTAANSIEYRLRDETAGLSSSVPTVTLLPTAPGAGRASTPVSLTWIFSVPTATSRTLRLQARQSAGADTVSAEMRSVTLLYVPFGSS